jgi:hypothetical protein
MKVGDAAVLPDLDTGIIAGRNGGYGASLQRDQPPLDGPGHDCWRRGLRGTPASSLIAGSRAGATLTSTMSDCRSMRGRQRAAGP